jgi:hypothetical protein
MNKRLTLGPLDKSKAIAILHQLAASYGLTVVQDTYAQDEYINIRIEPSEEDPGNYNLIIEFMAKVTEEQIVDFLEEEKDAIKRLYPRPQKSEDPF